MNRIGSISVYLREHPSLTHQFKRSFPRILSKPNPPKFVPSENGKILRIGPLVCGEIISSGQLADKCHVGTLWVYRREHPSLTHNFKRTFSSISKQAETTQTRSRGKQKHFCTSAVGISSGLIPRGALSATRDRTPSSRTTTPARSRRPTRKRTSRPRAPPIAAERRACARSRPKWPKPSRKSSPKRSRRSRELGKGRSGIKRPAEASRNGE